MRGGEGQRQTAERDSSDSPRFSARLLVTTIFCVFAILVVPIGLVYNQ